MSALVRLGVENPVLKLDAETVGAFVKLVVFGESMPIKGVFVNGDVYVTDELLKVSDINLGQLNKLVSEGLLTSFEGVYMLDSPDLYYSNNSYTESDVAPVVATLKAHFKSDTVAKILCEIENEVVIMKDVSRGDILAELKGMYAAFGEHRGLAISYMGSFRTKKQVDTGTKMALPKHHRLVKELLQMYQSSIIPYDGLDYPVSQEVFALALVETAQRNLVALSNHNYLKKVAMGRQELAKTGGGKRDERRISEGY